MKLLLYGLVAFMGLCANAAASMRFRGSNIREVVREANTNSIFTETFPCAGTSDNEEILFNNNDGCDGNAAFKFDYTNIRVGLGTSTDPDELFHVNKSTDGDSVLAVFENSQPAVNFDLNETASINLGLEGVNDAAILRVGEISHFTSVASQQATFSILQRDGSTNPVEVFHIRSSTAAGVFGAGSAPTNEWEVEGEMAVGASYAFNSVSAPTNGAIIEGQVGIGLNNPQSVVAGVPLVIGGTGKVLLYGTGPQLYFGRSSATADTDVVNLNASAGNASTDPERLSFQYDTGRNGHFLFDIESNGAGTPFDDESHGIVIAEETGTPGVYASRGIHLSSGTTVNGRYNHLIAPTYNGVAGGAAETVNNPATLYIDNEPQGTNVTFGAGPYALWVDDGDVRFDGPVTFNASSTQTGDLTIQKADPSMIYDVVTATDTDFWAGVQDDAGSDDDDKYQIGDGTTPGSNVHLTILTDGSVGLGNAAPASRLVVEIPSVQTIAAGNTITADGCGTIKRISSAGAVTTDTTNTFTAPAAGNSGCLMHIVNSGANNITLDANANFVSAGGADVVLTGNDAVVVGSTGSGGAWYQLAPVSVN